MSSDWQSNFDHVTNGEKILEKIGETIRETIVEKIGETIMETIGEMIGEKKIGETIR